MIAQLGLALSGLGYLIGTIGFLLEKNYWMAATLLLYGLCCGTIYMAGTNQ